MRLQKALTTVLLLVATAAAHPQVTLSRDDGMSVDAASDGRLAVDLQGDIWVIPGNGGDATQLTRNLRSAQRPRWSPDNSQLVFEASIDGRHGIWLYDIESRQTSFLSERSRLDRHPEWHPAGERVTYASDRNGSGFDLWEVDVATDLHWRISHRPGALTAASLRGSSKRIAVNRCK